MAVNKYETSKRYLQQYRTMVKSEENQPMADNEEDEDDKEMKRTAKTD